MGKNFTPLKPGEVRAVLIQNRDWGPVSVYSSQSFQGIKKEKGLKYTSVMLEGGTCGILHKCGMVPDLAIIKYSDRYYSDGRNDGTIVDLVEDEENSEPVSTNE